MEIIIGKNYIRIFKIQFHKSCNHLKVLEMGLEEMNRLKLPDREENLFFEGRVTFEDNRTIKNIETRRAQATHPNSGRPRRFHHPCLQNILPLREKRARKRRFL